MRPRYHLHDSNVFPDPDHSRGSASHTRFSVQTCSAQVDLASIFGRKDTSPGQHFTLWVHLPKFHMLYARGQNGVAERTEGDIERLFSPCASSLGTSNTLGKGPLAFRALARAFMYDHGTVSVTSKCNKLSSVPRKRHALHPGFQIRRKDPGASQECQLVGIVALEH